MLKDKLHFIFCWLQFNCNFSICYFLDIIGSFWEPLKNPLLWYIHFCLCTFEYKLLNLLKDKGAAFFTLKEWIPLRISSMNTLYKTGKISPCVCKGVPCQEQQEGKKTNQVWCLNQQVNFGMVISCDMEVSVRNWVVWGLQGWFQGWFKVVE